ncbi:unnamed protein product [Adineta steineri]|uniref:Bridge-like lipid transfer protein family member 1 C-terminal domain-containing protein n=1 Tax=Adineta steineri TaxID=433720 RepID=A0A816C266_9BILA|nr:unnamed protein product [Adineta steineri]CAF1616919.1 unnamed protein product [Adineta steineri]
MKSCFTTTIHEYALHLLNNNNHDHQQPPTVSSDNHLRIYFPEIHCYGNYSIQQKQENKTKGRLNIRTKIDILKLIITVNFIAQLVFVSKATIHEINEILAKVSGFDQFHFGATTKHTQNENDDEPKKDQQTTPSTLFTYTIHLSMKDFEVMGQTPSNTIKQNSILLYNKPLINALINIKLGLGQLLQIGSFQDGAYFETKLFLTTFITSKFKWDDPNKEAYFIRLAKPSFYWQPGAVDKGIAIPLQQYDPLTKLPTTDNLTPSEIITKQSIPIFDKTTISACSCDAIISSGSFEVFCFRFAENFQQTNIKWKSIDSESSPNIILNACCVLSEQYLMHSRIETNLDSIIGKHFSQLIRTITSTQLIEPINHSNDENNSSSNSNLLNAQAGGTKNILENIDESDDDDERIKRLEYEHLTLGQKIKTLNRRSQTSYETLKADLTRYEWLENAMTNSGHNRDRNRIDSASYKRTQSYDPSRPSHHTQ